MSKVPRSQLRAFRTNFPRSTVSSKWRNRLLGRVISSWSILLPECSTPWTPLHILTIQTKNIHLESNISPTVPSKKRRRVLFRACRWLFTVTNLHNQSEKKLVYHSWLLFTVRWSKEHKRFKSGFLSVKRLRSRRVISRRRGSCSCNNW